MAFTPFGDLTKNIGGGHDGANRIAAIGLTDRVSMEQFIWPAFQRDVDAAAEIDYVQDVSGSRVLRYVQDAQSGERPDVVWVTNPGYFVDTDLCEPTESALRDRYPASWTSASHGLWWPMYMEPIVAIYNAHYAQPPASWMDLTAGKWRDRMVFEQPWSMHTTGTALAELSGALDRETWDALVRGLADTRPLLVGDNERAVLEVATGARWIGLSNMNVARRIRAESPVRHVFLDPSPCIPAFGLLVRGARNPGLGRLFLEWLASENGQLALAAAGRVACLPDVGIPAFAKLAGQRVRPLFGAANWVTDPAPWADRYRAMFPASDEPVRYGKLSSLALTREEGIRASS